MKILHQVYAKVTTTMKHEKLHQEVTGNHYPVLSIQTEHYVEQVKHFHAEEFKKEKRKSLTTIVTITTTEQK